MERLPLELLSPELLRRALEPEEASLVRVLGRALEALRAPATSPASPQARTPFRLVATLAATTALAAGLILALPGWRDPAPEPAGSGRIAISNQGEIVLIRRPGEAAGWIVRFGSAGSPTPSQIILVLHGD